MVADGNTVSPAPFSIIAATNSAALTRSSHIKHKQILTTNASNMTCTYAMAPATGLTIAYTNTWLVSGTSVTCYPVMMTMDNRYSKGSLLDASVDYTLTANNGLAYGNIMTRAGWLWDPAGNYAEMVYDANVISSLNNGTYAPGTWVWIQDRSGGLVNKIYFTRNDSSLPNETFSSNAVWSASANYRVGFFPGGADAAMAR
jgi:hypothetical protein